MESPVAVLELLATSGDGKSFPLRAAVGAPIFMAAPDTYSCDVEISLFDSPLRPVQGEGSFQEAFAIGTLIASPPDPVDP